MNANPDLRKCQTIFHSRLCGGATFVHWWPPPFLLWVFLFVTYLHADELLQAMNPFRTGQLVMFQVKYDRSWHFFEILFYLIIGVFGGLYGAFVIKWNLQVQAFRKKYLKSYPILEATLLAVITAIICYPNMFLRIDMTESMEILFLECEGGHDYDELCE